VGETADAVDNGEAVQVRRVGNGLVVVRRQSGDGTQITVWVRQDAIGWNVERPQQVDSDALEDLPTAIEAGILSSRDPARNLKA
jgi:hypothetical protein